ncbi:aminoacyl-tRNA hydrolase [Carboxylicivirga sediminis]|uniref:Aminoacyl-tRNA hydrolase n=1 Tax=Carboxylicivirga sediminis TaxID=2006564 RepID=A0A941J019_9BACT|nr:alternative ribosome rescue aminoacyl-tRNA hydrolase ArfB [Carboxylicivirga sediminis]MBR8537719.1 aminoacyl-tRNA hydrolase [Carboxylicivirga sediminis]
MKTIRERDFLPELTFHATRSSGPGGQNVNKVNTKVILRFSIEASVLLSDNEKQVLLRKLNNKLTSDNELIISNQESRSQIHNKAAAIEQFYNLLSDALKPAKKRLRTKPTKASIERRLKTKKQQALKKATRRLKDM